MSEKKTGFDYTSIPAEQARWLQEQSKLITTDIRHTSASVLNIGKRLIEVRAVLGPVFDYWVRGEFDWSLGTAKQYMACATRFGNLDCAWVIQVSAMMVMVQANVPQSALDEIITAARSKRTVSKKMAEEIIARHLIGQFGTPGAATSKDHPSDLGKLKELKGRFLKTLISFRHDLAQIVTKAMTDTEREAVAAELERLAGAVESASSTAIRSASRELALV